MTLLSEAWYKMGTPCTFILSCIKAASFLFYIQTAELNLTAGRKRLLVSLLAWVLC